jgi:hypothetical protein
MSMSLGAWVAAVVAGHISLCILVEVLLQLHVSCFSVSSRFVVDGRVHMTHLIKGLLYLLFIPFWCVLPLVYVDAAGTSQEWTTHENLLSYMWYALASLSSVYLTELVSVLIPRKEVIASLHRLGMLAAIIMFKADLFEIWSFPVVVFVLGFLCTSSVLHLVLYRYNVKPNPSWYRGYGLVTAWGLVAMIHFHAYYLWIMLESSGGNTPTHIILIRAVVWGVHLLEHTIQLRVIYSIFVLSKGISHRRKQRRQQREEPGYGILVDTIEDAHPVDDLEVSTIRTDYEPVDDNDIEKPKRMSIFDFL